MKCIILAGGFATRLWPLTENKAKPLLHLKDKPLISHIVDRLPLDIEIIVSTNAVFEEDFRQWTESLKERALRVFVEDSSGDDFKKGALGATAHLIESEGLKEDILLLAGDNYFEFRVDDLINRFEGHPLLAAYDIKNREEAKKFGVVLEKEGRVIGFQEKPENPQSTLVSTGCLIFPATHLNDIVHYAKEKKDDLGGIFEYFIKQGQRVDVFRFDELWADIGSYESYLQMNQNLLNNELIESEGLQKEGVNEFSGGVFLGKNVVIKNSVIDHSIVMDNCIVENCVIRHCVIDSNCHLKNLDLSYKMIRQGSRIEK